MFTNVEKVKTGPYHELRDTMVAPAFSEGIVLNHSVLEDMSFKVHTISERTVEEQCAALRNSPLFHSSHAQEGDARDREGFLSCISCRYVDEGTSRCHCL